jgi:glycosyltransferase involved in cell wall biosynthesis
MVKNVLLTIIIPIYNNENFIIECLNSFINELTDECQVILINDGSTDRSAEIIKLNFSTYLANNSIKLVNIINSGPGAARNYGVSLAQSTYISFVDSDDVLFENYIEVILSILKSKDIDIIQFNFKNFLLIDDIEDLPIVKSHQISGDFNLSQVRNMIFGIGKWFPWTRIFRKEILLKYPFPTGVFYEDTMTIPFIFMENYKIKLINDCLYGYRINALSTTSNHKLIHVETLINFFSYLLTLNESIPINIFKVQLARTLSFFSIEFKNNIFENFEINKYINSLKFKYEVCKYLKTPDRFFLILPREYHLINKWRLQFLRKGRK